MKKIPKLGPWYDILLAAREIVERGDELTSIALSIEAKIKGTPLSTPAQIASGWLGNFYRWGYVLRIGRIRTKGRPSTVYKLTRWGEDFYEVTARPASDPMPYITGKVPKQALRVAANPQNTRGKRKE